MDMIERVAVAIRRDKFRRTGRESVFDETAITDNERSEARAAIEAMREPTEAMLTAGGYEFDGCTSDPGERCHTGIHVWHGMIDAALSGPQVEGGKDD